MVSVVPVTAHPIGTAGKPGRARLFPQDARASRRTSACRTSAIRCLDAARLTVNQQIVSVQYKLIEGALKTPTSRRSIDLDPRTVAELRRHRRRQLEERMATGQRGDDGYLFAKPDGSPIHPDLISQTFERAVAKLNVPRIRLHDLRHTHATILLQQNVHPKVVSERLGHSSVAFTMTVYQHVMLSLQAQAASTFATAVFGNG